jgi:hypothetical protein
MGSENAHGRVQNAKNGFGFDFLELYHKDGYEFLNHIVRVAGDETGFHLLMWTPKSSQCSKVGLLSPDYTALYPATTAVSASVPT